MPGRSTEFEVLLDDLRTALEDLYGDRLVLYESQSKTTTASTVILRVEYAISKFPNCGTSSEGTENPSSARLRLVASEGRSTDALAAVREVADEKDLRVVEPLTEGSA